MEILKNNSFVSFKKLQGKALVEIFVEGCMACEFLKRKILPDIELNYKNIEIGLLNGNLYPLIVGEIEKDSNQAVMSVPVLVLYEDGKFLRRKTFFNPKKEDVEDFINGD